MDVICFLKTLPTQLSQAETTKLFQLIAKQVSQLDFSKIDDYILGLKIKKNITEEELVKLIINRNNYWQNVTQINVLKTPDSKITLNQNTKYQDAKLFESVII